VLRETATRVSVARDAELFEELQEQAPVQSLGAPNRVQTENARASIPFDLLLGADAPTIFSITARGQEVRLRVSLTLGRLIVELLPSDQLNQELF
jgi:hypothetical protein